MLKEKLKKIIKEVDRLDEEYFYDIKELLKKVIEKDDVNYQDDSGHTLLMHEVSLENYVNVYLLLSLGANPLIRDCYDNDCFDIFFEDSNDAGDIIRLLIDFTNDVNHKYKHGDTLLINEVKKGRIENIIYLLNKGADISLKNNEGKTALDIAKEQKHYNDVIYVLENMVANSKTDIQVIDEKTPQEMLEEARNKLMLLLK